MIRILAPAKVNWFLEVLGKRPDGYHEIETVMQAIDLFDEITVEPADELTLRCNIDLGPQEGNLAYRAAALMRDEAAPGEGASITLTKRIPHGAGLGGGSSDAASTLLALNRLWGLGLEPARLNELAARIGSDCAFFIEGGMSHCTGRGEIIRPLPDLPVMHLVILYPGEVCPTGPVYAHVGRHLTGSHETCFLANDSSSVRGAATLGSLVFNRLQDSALAVSAGLRSAWEQTGDESGVIRRFVSGSGSSVAFLVASQHEATALHDSFEQRGLGQSFAVRTLPRGAVWG